MHWGFLAWAVLGSLTAILLAYAHYGQGKPLQPRTLLHPVFGDWILTSWLGGVVDALCVIAIVAGTVGPIGFLALFLFHWLSYLRFGQVHRPLLQWQESRILLNKICERLFLQRK